MTNFDITSFFKRTSEKNLSTTTTAAAATTGVQPSTSSPPGLEQQQQTNNGGTGEAFANEAKTTTTSDGASLLPTNAHRISYDIASVWTNTTANTGGGTSENSTMVVHQPHTTPIAHVTSSLPPPVLPRDGTITAECEEGKVTAISGCGGSRLIDWNDHFTVYVVKGGLIRVIDRLSGSRSLLRGHSVKGQSTSYVRDMVFYNKSSDILATVGTLPNNTTTDINTSSSTTGILIWRLYRSPDGDEVSQECLLEIRCSGASTSEATQIAWHPSNTNIFAVSHGTKVTIVESTKLQTTPIMDETSGRSHAMCTLAGTSFPSGNVTSGQMVLGDDEGGDDGHTDVILDIAWCHSNPRYLFTCGCDGTVRAWDIVTSKCLWTIPLAEELSSSNQSNMIVTRCISFGSSSDGDGGGGGGPPPPGLGLPTTTTSSTSLVVSSYDLTSGVTTLSMFSFSTDLISKRPSLSHVLDFVSSDTGTGSNVDPSLFCLSICRPPSSTVAHTADEKSKGVYILLSQLYTGGTNVTRSISADNSTNTPLMFVLHALPKPSSSSPSDYKFVKVTPYKLLHPLLSWSTGYSIREYDHDATNDNDNDVNGSQQLLKAGTDMDLWDISTYVVQTKAVQTLQIGSQQASLSSSVLSVLSGDEIGQGVTVIVPGNKATTSATSINEESSSPMISINNTTEGDAVEMYDMEGEEEEEEEEHDDHDHHDQDNYVLPTSSITTTTTAPGAAAGGGPFTNWLGAIAASSSSTASRPVPAPPQPVEPQVVDTSSDTVGLASGSSSSNKLLTPTEILGIATTTAPASAATNSSNSNNAGGKKSSATNNATEGQKTKNKATKQNNRKSRSPARSPGRTKTPTKKAGAAAAEANGGGSTTSSTKTQKQGNKMMTVNGASTPGQVKILKRQERPTTPTPSVVAPSSPAAASTQTKLPPPPPGVTAKEMEECVSRALSSTVTEQHRTLVKTLQDEMYTKLVSNMESQYKVQSNRLTQSVTSKVSSSVKEPLKEAFYSTMREVMIPAMEVTTQQMLQQVSKVVEDHLSHIQQQRTQDDATARHVVETSASVTKLVQMVESLTLEVSRLQKQVAESSATTASAAAAAAAAAAVQTPSTGIAGSAALGGVSGGPVGAVGGAGAVPPGLGGGGGHQQSRGSVHGGGIPPMVQVQQVDPYASLRQEMLTNLNRRNYEVAFTQALSSNNAEMTKFCCRNVDMFSVLGQDDGGNVKLSQPILLCILQQLGSTLSNSPPHGAQQDVKMELEWMQEIALSLNATEPSIRRHVPQVISQLLGNIETKLAQGDPALRRPLQTLLQVIRGISY